MTSKFKLLRFKKLYIIVCLIALISQLQAEEPTIIFEKIWQDDYQFSNGELQGSKLVVDNVIGGIEVVSSASSEITVNIDSYLSGTTEQDLKIAEDELKLIVEKTSYGLLVFLESPFRNYSQEYQEHSRNYRYKYDINIQVPHNFDLDLHNVSGGDIRLSGMNGALNIRTTTGDVILLESSGPGKVESLSGNIILSYKKTPNLSVKLQSCFGKMSTDFEFDHMQSSPLTVTEIGRMTRYKKNSISHIQFGQEGSNIQLKSLSGDITFKELTN